MGDATLQVEAIDRQSMGRVIAARLAGARERLAAEFHTPGAIPACILDDVLPASWAHRIYEQFPETGAMRHRRTLREDKFVAAQMNRYPPLLEEAVYAFQHPEVLAEVAAITGLKALEPDELLYAGGISVMAKNNFLNPHLDNSHDNDRSRYRVLNLLYYVSPDWKSENGGNLELWDDGPEGAPREIVSAFNRLVIMITNRRSWHSVNKVRVDARRCCVSNYYFSAYPADEQDYFHVTSFRGRPEQPIRDIVLRLDQKTRTAIRSVASKGLGKTTHIYKKDDG